MFTYKLTHSNAKAPERKGGSGAAGYDMYAIEGKVVKPGEIYMMPTGVQVTAFSEGWVAFVKERSGLALKGIRIGGGVIDPSYRGEIFIAFHNLGASDYVVETGHRVAQIVFLKIGHHDFKVYESDKVIEPSSFIGGNGSSGL